MDFSNQILCIKKKLLQAKVHDAEFKVFGATGHKYHLNPPVETSQVEAFEKQYGILLPDCYKAFVQHIGNGGGSYQNSGAGPYYGIYPLGGSLDQLVPEDPETFLKKPCCLKPNITDLDWESLTQILDDEDTLDEIYDEELENLYGGILPLGFQGCSYVHGLVLNGPYKGQVVHVEMSTVDKPIFSKDENFLEWYERWLDEILADDPAKKISSWYR